MSHGLHRNARRHAYNNKREWQEVYTDQDDRQRGEKPRKKDKDRG